MTSLIGGCKPRISPGSGCHTFGYVRFWVYNCCIKLMNQMWDTEPQITIIPDNLFLLLLVCTVSTWEKDANPAAPAFTSEFLLHLSLAGRGLSRITGLAGISGLGPNSEPCGNNRSFPETREHARGPVKKIGSRDWIFGLVNSTYFFKITNHN